MRTRMKAHCEDKEHQPWPAQGRHSRHAGADASHERATLFQADVDTLKQSPLDQPEATSVPRLHLVDGFQVDPLTGEMRE